MTRLSKVDADDKSLRHPSSREYAIDQAWVDRLWEAYTQNNQMFNLCGAKNLPGKRECIGLSVFPSSFGSGFTAAVRARDTGKGGRAWVIYSSADAPEDALWAAVMYASDPEAEWKEAKVWQRDTASEGAPGRVSRRDLQP